MIYVVIVLASIIVIQIVYADRLDERRRKYADELCERWIAEREKWNEERQQLLDRIQAPSYDHLKHHEVKIIKAQKEDKKDETRLEPV
ncbi:hypothetical protein [Paenibacillus sabinae]|uniref:Phage protein n=1 Tax=Paenibacillus sabinae T27 TaxID=1268072 RepID=X4ZV09_9BACL|nr:hypothetical protein [Paenibacillus sabinae]AHV96148.1 Phage protein [Paenibacillus sabinae T27]